MGLTVVDALSGNKITRELARVVRDYEPDTVRASSFCPKPGWITKQFLDCSLKGQRAHSV